MVRVSQHSSTHWYFGMKAHLGMKNTGSIVDAATVHAANAADSTPYPINSFFTRFFDQECIINKCK
jgi:hypothetical protein